MLQHHFGFKNSTAYIRILLLTLEKSFNKEIMNLLHKVVMHIIFYINMFVKYGYFVYFLPFIIWIIAINNETYTIDKIIDKALNYN